MARVGEIKFATVSQKPLSLRQKAPGRAGMHGTVPKMHSGLETRDPRNNLIILFYDTSDLDFSVVGKFA